MILYRPVGLEELLLIYKTGLQTFPPRLPEQPIFYPVLNLGYATQIARDWNTKSGSLAGYVIELEIDDHYAASLPVRQAGARQHQELWIAAEALDEFNRHIVDRMRIVAAYFGENFSGLIPAKFSLRGKDARAQLGSLWSIYKYSIMDFHGEITANHEAVFAHFPFWEQAIGTYGAFMDFNAEELLGAVRQVWCRAFPAIPLGVESPRS